MCCRPRICKDYHYIVANSETIGSNEPLNFSILLRGNEYFGLAAQSAKAFTDAYEGIKDKRDRFARQLALDVKIERSEVSEGLGTGRGGGKGGGGGRGGFF